MPRTARVIGDSGIYHVMLRGINRQRIFEDDEDRYRFLEILKKTNWTQRWAKHKGGRIDPTGVQADGDQYRCDT